MPFIGSIDLNCTAPLRDRDKNDLQDIVTRENVSASITVDYEEDSNTDVVYISCEIDVEKRKEASEIYWQIQDDLEGLPFFSFRAHQHPLDEK
jgi:hypothetical protein